MCLHFICMNISAIAKQRWSHTISSIATQRWSHFVWYVLWTYNENTELTTKDNSTGGNCVVHSVVSYCRCALVTFEPRSLNPTHCTPLAVNHLNNTTHLYKGGRGKAAINQWSSFIFIKIGNVSLPAGCCPRAENAPSWKCSCGSLCFWTVTPRLSLVVVVQEHKFVQLYLEVSLIMGSYFWRWGGDMQKVVLGENHIWASPALASWMTAINEGEDLDKKPFRSHIQIREKVWNKMEGWSFCWKLVPCCHSSYPAVIHSHFFSEAET